MGKAKAAAAVVLPNVLLRRPHENIPPKVQHGRNAEGKKVEVVQQWLLALRW